MLHGWMVAARRFPGTLGLEDLGLVAEQLRGTLVEGIWAIDPETVIGEADDLLFGGFLPYVATSVPETTGFWHRSDDRDYSQIISANPGFSRSRVRGRRSMSAALVDRRVCDFLAEGDSAGAARALEHARSFHFDRLGVPRAALLSSEDSRIREGALRIAADVLRDPDQCATLVMPRVLDDVLEVRVAALAALERLVQTYHGEYGRLARNYVLGICRNRAVLEELGNGDGPSMHPSIIVGALRVLGGYAPDDMVARGLGHVQPEVRAAAARCAGSDMSETLLAVACAEQDRWVRAAVIERLAWLTPSGARSSTPPLRALRALATEGGDLTLLTNGGRFAMAVSHRIRERLLDLEERLDEGALLLALTLAFDPERAGSYEPLSRLRRDLEEAIALFVRWLDAPALVSESYRHAIRDGELELMLLHDLRLLERLAEPLLTESLQAEATLEPWTPGQPLR